MTDGGKSQYSDPSFFEAISVFCQSLWPGCAVCGCEAYGSNPKSPNRVTKVTLIGQNLNISQSCEKDVFLPAELPLRLCGPCKRKVTAGLSVIRPIDLHKGDSASLLKALSDAFSVVLERFQGNKAPPSSDTEKENICPNGTMSVMKTPNPKKRPLGNHRSETFKIPVSVDAPSVDTPKKKIFGETPSNYSAKDLGKTLVAKYGRGLPKHVLEEKIIRSLSASQLKNIKLIRRAVSKSFQVSTRYWNRKWSRIRGECSEPQYPSSQQQCRLPSFENESIMDFDIPLDVSPPESLHKDSNIYYCEICNFRIQPPEEVHINLAQAPNLQQLPQQPNVPVDRRRPDLQVYRMHPHLHQADLDFIDFLLVHDLLRHLNSKLYLQRIHLHQKNSMWLVRETRTSMTTFRLFF